MARVTHVGAHVDTAPAAGAVGGEPNRYSFCLWLFAELSDGAVVRAPAALEIGTPRLADTLNQLERDIAAALGHENMPPEKRAAFWRPLVSALQEAGIATDAETLMRLDFRVDPTDRVRALFE